MQKVGKIKVPVAFSEHSTNLIDYAANLAACL